MKPAQFDSLTRYIDMLLDAICVVDKEGHFLYVSAGGERIFGYKPEEMIGRQMLEMVHPDDRERTLQTVAEIMSGVAKIDFENRYIRKDGQVIDLLWSARWSEADNLRVAVARDITGQKRSQALQKALFNISEAAHTQASLPALYQRIHQIIAELMPVGQFAIALYDPDTTAVRFPYQNIETDKLHKLDVATFCSEVSTKGESQLKQIDDSCEWLGIPLKSQNGVIGSLMVTTDTPRQHFSLSEKTLLEFVSAQVASAIERKQMLERLHQLAMYDALTGLPNRQLFDDRVNQALNRAKRQDTQLALLYLDLDKFKAANDTHGHEVGDRLLVEVARRLAACVRESDTVTRFGGDEFVILLDAVNNSEVVTPIAEKVLDALAKPYLIETQSIEMAASIGIAMYPSNGLDETALLRHADAAMYAAKRQGGNCFKD
jgi:diguanylate cyclase (GGDEF)-like protein/PAS domain S-box-containing protein